MGALVSLMINSPRLPKILRSPTFIKDLQLLERALARQIVGFDTRSIMDLNFTEGRERDPLILYDQPFTMFPGNDTEDVVELALQKWAVEQRLINLKEDPELFTESSALIVTGFQKWTVGESYIYVDSA